MTGAPLHIGLSPNVCLCVPPFAKTDCPLSGAKGKVRQTRQVSPRQVPAIKVKNTTKVSKKRKFIMCAGQ